ncbi:MAG: class I SAM-dependent methyltransferase [Bdellovibrionota bacterium]
MSNHSRSVSNRAGYDQWSSFYDQYSNPTVAIDELHFPEVWNHLQKKSVLEIGCGTGRHTIKLAAQGNQVVGLDLSNGMLGEARRKLEGKPVELIEADFMTYEGFDKEGFDVVISSLVLEHIPDLKVLFAKIASLLKPGGEVFLSEIHPSRASSGALAHFKDSQTSQEIRLESFVHSDESFRLAAQLAGLQIQTERDILGEERLKLLNSAWDRYLKIPMIKIWGMRKAEGEAATGVKSPWTSAPG